MVKRGNIKDHIKFTYRKIKWTGGGRYIPERGEHKKFGEVKQAVEKIKFTSEKKDQIITDNNLYFVIVFTEELNSPNINRLINSFNLMRIIKIFDSHTAKFSLNKDHYPNFLAFIERKNKYFATIRGVTLRDLFDEDLLKEMKNIELNNIDVTIEFSSSLSAKSESIKNGLEEYLTKTKCGKIKTFEKIGYNILCSMTVKKDNIKELASQLDGISLIQKEKKPILNQFYLQSIEKRTTKHHKARLKCNKKKSSLVIINVWQF